jgi:hypothetical protein
MVQSARIRNLSHSRSRVGHSVPFHVPLVAPIALQVTGLRSQPEEGARLAIVSLYQFKYQLLPRASTPCLSFVHKCFWNFIVVDLGR